ncbi:HNH endonuclease [Escherichia coli]|uniref:HNH endonuclease n=1 Tax=Escherichia coli TaxID=562 RepID=UPI001C5CE616|nr:HNH endonuclease [Escherichia coli]EFI6316189.1 hypothetical protein [Escherichia coli]EFN4182347.1 HNH endonuclease [Escherichia coli]EGH1063607.1 HNH endonuclease [Escherichia coli]EGK5790008.1 HNH endonuclease [Escherichia coli]
MNGDKRKLYVNTLALDLNIKPSRPYYQILLKTIKKKVADGQSKAEIVASIKNSKEHLANITSTGLPAKSTTKKSRTKGTPTGIINHQKQNISFKKTMRSSSVRDDLRKRRIEYVLEKRELEAKDRAARKEQDEKRKALEKIRMENLPEIVENCIDFSKRRDFQLWFHRTGQYLNTSAQGIVNEFLAEFKIENPIVKAEIKLIGSPETPLIVTQLPIETKKVEFIPQPLPSKRVGEKVTITSRPDQAKFADSVGVNCRYTCVVTGVKTRVRCEAAHIVEHKAGGVDHYTNGLWLRVDIHRLFDAGLCAIEPSTMMIYFNPMVLIDDPDLEKYHAIPISQPVRPINPDYLMARWTIFNIR